jgi:autotransporter-associated beta strand protein
LLAATAHTLTFANSAAVSWTSPATINITGWSGAYNGTAGTGGRIFVGSTATGLTASQLAQILFFNGTNYFRATILGTGEVVPTATIAMFWGGTAAENWVIGSKWSLVNGIPYTSNWTNGRAAIFNVSSSTITHTTTGPTVSSITANENVTVTYTSGTFSTGGTVAPIYVANSKLLNLAGTAIATAAGTGIIKNGPGTLQLTGAAYPGGFTLNSGMVVAGGATAMGDGGTLTINAGTIAANATRDFSNRLDLGITIGGDFTLGSSTSPAVGTSNLTFNNNTALGSSVTRTITLGGTGTYAWNGIISGTSSNLTIAATAAGTLALGGANTYGGNTTINGGTVRPTVATALPSTTGLTFANTAGAILDLSTNALAHTVASLSGGGSTGGNIAFGASTTTTLTVGNASNTTYSGLISGASLTTGGLVKVGSGILTLGHTANTYAGTTTITAGELRLNPSTTTGSFASQIILNGGKLSTTGIATSTVFTSTSTLNLNATSTLDLGSNAHELRFANSSGVTWNGAALVINNWVGTPSAAGTAGRIFVGSANTHLTAGQLAKISFTGYVGAMLLASGELVPVSAPTIYTWDGSASSDWATGANWDLGTVPLSTDYVIIPTAASYTNALIITGARTVTDFTVNGTGTYSIAAAASLTVNGTFNYASSVAATYNCASTLTIASTASQTIPAANYGNLDLTGGARVLASSGTIGICGTFTRGAGAYTVTGSTVDYNGSGAQTISCWYL